MATTARKREKKSVKEVVEKLPPIPQEESLEFLLPDHFRLIETGQRDIENAQLRCAVEEQSLQNMILELKFLQAKIEQQKSLVAQKAAKFEAEKRKFENLKKEIFPMYGYKEGEAFSYDAESGKIVK